MICSLILKTSDRTAFAELLGYFNKILSITQQSDSLKIVKPDMFKTLGRGVMAHYKQSFLSAMISPCIHEMCPFMGIVRDNKWETNRYAEQSDEAWNKHIRTYKSRPASRARQCSIRLITLDIFTRMLVQTHPIIASKKRIKQCKTCEKYGHTVRSCPLNYQVLSSHVISRFSLLSTSVISFLVHF